MGNSTKQSQTSRDEGKLAFFEEFWKVYPQKKTGLQKEHCKDIWERRNLDSKVDELIEDVKARQERDSLWRRGNVPPVDKYLKYRYSMYGIEDSSTAEPGDDEYVPMKEQYKDRRWQQKRLEIMQRDNWQCQRCYKSEGVSLNVHHSYYDKSRAPWEYPDDALHTWCEKCHEGHYEAMKKFQRFEARLSQQQTMGLQSLRVHNMLETLGTLADLSLDDDTISKAISAVLEQGCKEREKALNGEDDV